MSQNVDNCPGTVARRTGLLADNLLKTLPPMWRCFAIGHPWRRCQRDWPMTQYV
jgi:hypothetical protein